MRASWPWENLSHSKRRLLLVAPVSFCTQVHLCGRGVFFQPKHRFKCCQTISMHFVFGIPDAYKNLVFLSMLTGSARYYMLLLLGVDIRSGRCSYIIDTICRLYLIPWTRLWQRPSVHVEVLAIFVPFTWKTTLNVNTWSSWNRRSDGARNRVLEKSFEVTNAVSRVGISSADGWIYHLQLGACWDSAYTFLREWRKPFTNPWWSFDRIIFDAISTLHWHLSDQLSEGHSVSVDV